MAVDKIRGLVAFAITGLLFAILLVPLGLTRIQGAESRSIQRNIDPPSIELPRRPVTLGKSVPLVIRGVTLGTAVVYPGYGRGKSDDYLEVYNRAGNLVAVVWFDRFGIRRAAVDRSFLRGQKQLEGVFVPVDDGEIV